MSRGSFPSLDSSLVFIDDASGSFLLPGQRREPFSCTPPDIFFFFSEQEGTGPGLSPCPLPPAGVIETLKKIILLLSRLFFSSRPCDGGFPPRFLARYHFTSSSFFLISFLSLEKGIKGDEGSSGASSSFLCDLVKRELSFFCWFLWFFFLEDPTDKEGKFGFS